MEQQLTVDPLPLIRMQTNPHAALWWQQIDNSRLRVQLRYDLMQTVVTDGGEVALIISSAAIVACLVPDVSGQIQEITIYEAHYHSPCTCTPNIICLVYMFGTCIYYLVHVYNILVHVYIMYILYTCTYTKLGGQYG